MSILSFLRPKPRPFFPPGDVERIAQAISAAESRTSGEIRLYVESRCRFVDPVDRAAEVFHHLGMDGTRDRNGVLLYIAIKDRQLAIFADEGIHRLMGSAYWNAEAAKILGAFRTEHALDGILMMVEDIGSALVEHFPREEDDRNELPDHPIFGN